MEIMESQEKLRSHLSELKKFREEANAEPSFWFSPFNFSCYEKLFKSLSKMADLLQLSSHATGFLGKQGRSKSPILKDIDKDLKRLTQSICLLVKSLEEITLLKPLDALEKAFAKNDNTSWDIELGKTPKPSLSWEESEPEKILETYLQHCRSFVDEIFRVERGEEEVDVDKSEVVLSLSTLGFCVEQFGKETREIKEMVKEIVQSENPSSHVNLQEISCKIRSLHK